MHKLAFTALIASTILASTAVAQNISVGVLGGANFNDVVSAANTGSYQAVANSSNFSIGPALRVNLPASFRIEVDALYRPYGFNLNGPSGISYAVTAKQISFPVLLQYRLGGPAPLVHPFVEAGLSFNHLAGISNAASSVITSGPGALLHQSDAGFVLGAGLDVKIPFFRLSGELRYTRQTTSEFANISNLNQAEVLFGVHF